MMNEHDDTKIRDRAYALWERAGSPEGRQEEFWHAAERELAEEGGTDTSERASTITAPPPVPGSVPK